MSSRHFQTFLAGATQRASDALHAALLNLPADKRAWSPGGTARTALNQIAECAIINGGVALAIADPAGAAKYDMTSFQASVDSLAENEDEATGQLAENTAKLVEAIGTVDDDSLDTEIQLPWGKWTIGHLIAHPYWNMAYHEGQLNYIASQLEGA